MAYSQSPRESGEESEEDEMIEESPCGRWSKRLEVVDQRDVPGIAGAYLAMDNEEGVEVVWNELLFNSTRHFKNEEIKYREMFDCMSQLEHPNIVKFHRYWSDIHDEKPRIVFITEYMSSGSWKQFLKRTKRNVKKLSLHAWRRWCTQILSALGYLHSSKPPIVHANLTCDTIFIQHNGLVKIGSVSPESIHHYVISSPEYKQHHHSNMRILEYGPPPTEVMDVYSFGLCALEMAAVDMQGDDDAGGKLVSEKQIQQTIASLEDSNQRDFLQQCLHEDPAQRSTVRELLFHPLLFEVPSLKLLSAHSIVNSSPIFSDTIIDERMQPLYKSDSILAYIQREDQPVEVRLRDVPPVEKLEKLIEDVKYGIHPITVFAPKRMANIRIRALSPDAAESVKSTTPEPVDIETREIVNMMCSVKPREATATNELVMTLLLRMDDKMNRQLTCQVSPDDSATTLTNELVHLGFIHENDREKIIVLIDNTLQQLSSQQSQNQILQSQSQSSHQQTDIKQNTSH